MTRTPVQGTTPVGAYSPGIIAEGRFLYVSGQGPLIDGAYEPASAEEETRLTLENIGRILASAGAGFDDVLAPIQLVGAGLILVGVVIAQTADRPRGAPAPAAPLDGELRPESAG